MERARDMPALESLWAANIQQHKPGRARSQRRVNVPAVGFERQELLKVIEGRLRIVFDLIVYVHKTTVARFKNFVDRQKCQYALKSCHALLRPSARGYSALR